MDNSGSKYPIQEGTLIIIRTSAELYLSGIEEQEVQVYGAEDRVQIRQEEGVFRIENHSGMDLSVPVNANVRVERVGGDAFLQDLGALDLQKVGGNLSLQRVDQALIGRVGGDLTVREVSGDFKVQKVGGDLVARELSGLVAVDSVGGDGDVQATGEGDFALRTGGDLVVQFTRTVGSDVALYAGGDGSLFLPASANARISVSAGGEDILISLDHQGEPVHENVEQRHHEFELGGGDGHIQMAVGGDCEISDADREPSSLAGEFDRLETSWQNARENRERYGWPGHFDPARSAAWADMVGRRAQEAARRAEMRAQSAVRRAEDQARRAEERARRNEDHEQHRGGGWGGSFSFDFDPFKGGSKAPQPPTPPPAPQVTEQERLMILQMLQDNKITVEQAEALLRALEGRYSK